MRGRRGARLLALTSGGAIPEVADYRVVLEPDDTFIGTLNEDFAIESMRRRHLPARQRVVADPAGRPAARCASPTRKGAPPTIPFWLGEAPARSDELSRAVSDLRAERRCGRAAGRADGDAGDVDWLMHETGVAADAARAG